MNKAQKNILFITFLLGIISPFVPFLAITFFVSLSFLILFTIAAAIYWVTTFFGNKSDRKDALFLFMLIPILILSQLFAVFVVNKTQRMRSEAFITEIEEIKSKTGRFPETYDTYFGIKYKKSIAGNSYEVFYNKGFLITERYTSETKTWKNYGWND